MKMKINGIKTFLCDSTFCINSDLEVSVIFGPFLRNKKKSARRAKL
jgi:hypothetical protein